MGFFRNISHSISAVRPPNDDYELLPHNDTSLPLNNSPIINGATKRTWIRRCVQFFSIRRVLLLLVLTPILLVFSSGIPPSYASYWQYEQFLPQHNLSLPPPEGGNGSFVRFSNSLWGHGWNNILQERILLSHLAFLSNRSYVFEPYTWSHTPFPYTLYDFALRPSRIPLNAIISGPGAGGGTSVPRAISSEWWQVVCPAEKRVVLDSTAINEGLERAEGAEILQKWVHTLVETNTSCVEVGADSPPVFDWDLFGTPRLLSIWPTLSISPISKFFTWSPVVTSAVMENLPLLTSDKFQTLPHTFPGLLALHIRRGDYVRHCPRLFSWSTNFWGYNTFPTLPESSHFDPPPVSSPNERLAYYTRRCWPSYDDIASRIAEVQQQWESRAPNGRLDRIYVLTNGGRWWSHWLRERLVRDGWERNKIKVTSGLSLGRDARYVDFAVDMAIAERAEVLIGNGFSSLTSNLIMLRMARGIDPQSNHLW